MRIGRSFPARPIINRVSLVILFSPLPPTNLAASIADGSTTTALSWTNNASPLTNTRVEVSSDGVTGWAEIATSPVTSPGASTTHAVGTNSVTRYYRARAYNAANGYYSGYSGTVSITTAPAAPSGFAVAAVNNSNNLILTWTDNSSDETGFGVERSNNGVSGWTEITVTASGAVTYTDSSVGARDTLRYYRVRAKRSGDSINSNYATSASATTAPADPTSIVLTGGSASVSVAFTNNSSSATAIKVERKTGSGGVYAEIGSTATSPYADSTTAIETTYYYKVRAYRSSDGIYSGYAAEQSVTTGETAPSNLVASCIDDTTAASKVQLFWDSNTVLDNGFRVQRSTDNSTWSTIGTTARGILTYTDTVLTSNTTYYYRVAALNDAGNVSDYVSTSVKTTKGTVGDLYHAFMKKINQFPQA